MPLRVHLVETLQFRTKGALDQAGHEDPDGQSHEGVFGRGDEPFGKVSAERLEGVAHQLDAEEEDVEREQEQQHPSDLAAELIC